MNDQLLSALSLYGNPALFAIVAIAATGVPLPITLLLIVAGSLVSQGVLDLWTAIAVASVGSIAGDLAGYAIGRWGGPVAVKRIARAFGAEAQIPRAEEKVRSWGGAAVFFTRWLIGPLGPWVNLIAGAIGYPWPRFLLWDAVGELMDAALFISLGRVFSDRVIAMGSLVGDVTWALVGVVVAGVIGWQLVGYFRRRA